MPLQDKSVNKQFSDMQIGQDYYDDETLRMMYDDSMDENSFPAMKVEKAESQLLHKNFYNSFIDVLQPLKQIHRK